MLLGCIADDFTGATDLANELANRGLRASVRIGIPVEPHDDKDEAIVIALKSRSIEPDLAVELSLKALDWLRANKCERVYFKYCSTFDSTDRGNIGPVLEALAEELGARAVIACPAFPATGRTVFQGHLFVGDRLLSESPMRHHPLNPMHDADLVRVLQRQMTGLVRLLPMATVRSPGMDRHVERLRQESTIAVIADAIDDGDLAALGRHCANVKLSSGASGLAAGIALALVEPGTERASAKLPRMTAGRRVILSGSCSAKTLAQIATASPTCAVYQLRLGRAQTVSQALASAKNWIDGQDSGHPLLIYSSTSPAEVSAQREAYGSDASAAYEQILADLADYLVEGGTGALIVAGGETSGAVVKRLGVSRLAIGPEIDAGVPWTIATRRAGEPPLPLALKSGNFGAEDFFLKAWEHLA